MRILIALLIAVICNSFAIAAPIIEREFTTPMIHRPVDDSIVLWITGRGSRHNANNTTLSDLSKYKNNGKIIGARWVPISYPMQHDVLSFDGNDDNVNLGDITQLNSVSEFTISFWMNQDILDVTDTIFTKFIDTFNNFEIFTFSGNLFAALETGGSGQVYFDYSSVISAGKWAFLTVVYDSSLTGNTNRLKIYVDGSSQTLSTSGTIQTMTANLSGIDAYIGKSAGSFDGKLDEFRIYNRALNSAKIMEEYNRTKAWYGE